MLILFATMQFMAGVVFVGFFFSGEAGGLGIVLAVSHLNLKVLNYQKNPKTLEWKSPLSP